MPAIEIMLTVIDLTDYNLPGYEHGNPMVKPIMIGQNNNYVFPYKSKEKKAVLSTVMRKRNLNDDFRLPPSTNPTSNFV